MPVLGLGTWQNDDAETCADSVQTALEMGYRHIDTAQAYGNEDAVGDGLAAADVDREDIFLATKVWISNLSREDVIETAERSLDDLGVDSVDLLYVHWPAGEYDAAETLAAFDELYEQGKIDRIGVSNFEPRHVEEAMEVLDAPLFANQVEIHPFLQQEEPGPHRRQLRKRRSGALSVGDRTHRRHRARRPPRRSGFRPGRVGVSGQLDG